MLAIARRRQDFNLLQDGFAKERSTHVYKYEVDRDGAILIPGPRRDRLLLHDPGPMRATFALMHPLAGGWPR